MRFYLLLILASPLALNAEVDFNRDVRPILSDKCFACHGPDEHDRKADLRLDTLEGATHNNDGITAIVPGDLEASEAWYRIITDDEDDLMPPEKFNKPITEEERAILKEWIESGAEYKDHWAYTPITRPEVTGTPSKAIDHLVEQSRAKAGFTPAPAADAATLARRLSLDLTGLAPTPKEVETFTQNYFRDPTSAIQLESARLLDTPAYGERMAVYWLDLARFADTIGYHSDNTHPVSAYRDYVIDSFNQNLPYDQFIREQLAGDLLPNATTEQRIASAYNRLLQSTEEGGAQAREYQKIHAADRVRNTSLLFLGSTIGCAQCHDHKYDPFTAHDFYSFAAFFDDVKEKPIGRREANLKLPTPEEQAELDELANNLATQTVAHALTTDSALAAQVATDQKAWEQSPTRDENLTALIPASVSTSGSAHTILPNGTVRLTPGNNPLKENLTVKAPATAGSYSAVILDALEDPEFVNGGLTAAGNGNFVLTRIQAFHKGKEIKLIRAEADFSQKDWPVAHAINGNGSQGWAVNGHSKSAPHTALFSFEKPIEATDGDEIQIRLQHQSTHGYHTIGKFQISLTSIPNPNFAAVIGPDLAIAALLAKQDRTPEEQSQIDTYYLSIAPALTPLNDKRAQWDTRQRDLDQSLRRALVSEALPEANMRTTTMLNRGDWMDTTGDVVLPAVPAFLDTSEAPADPAVRLTRLDLANWIASPENPLTARAFVNRVWMLFFGRGIASDVGDLGGQGTPPDHPKLLDYLAAEFINSGWDIKHLISSITTSSTYQQSSTTSPELLASDPDNVNLSRQGRWRMEGEFVRDIALQHANLLVHQQGGDSVKPLQPAGYWAQLNFPKRTWEVSPDNSDRYRRGLYTFWCRSFLHPAMVAFDAPTREECTPQRTRSNIPQQALVLLNDPSFVEAATALAQRTLNEGGTTDEQRIRWLFNEVLTRPPLTEESNLLTDLLTTTRSPSEIPNDLATWTAVTRALINTYETTSRF